MKHMRILTAGLSLLLLAGCGGTDPAGMSADGTSADGTAAVSQPDELPSLAEDETPTVLTCRIVDGAEDGNLLLAELEEGLYGGTGVYRLNVKDVPVTIDGEPVDASALEDGMPVDIAFNGNVLESFPAQFGEVYSVTAWSRGQGKNPAGATYDLCGLYLRVLDDLWQRDPALNTDISLAGLDLSTAPGELTDSEKSALAWRFGEMHGVEVVTGTFEELEEQGYFTATAISTPAPEEGEDFSHMWVQWEDGCLFSITANESHEGEMYSLPVLFFNAEKWRTPLAAYFFYDCSATWAEMGTWNDYKIGSEMIS